MSDFMLTAGSKQAKNKKLSRDMISLPQGDFRHVAHIGLNGNTFGNVTFLDSGEVAPAKSKLLFMIISF